MKKKDNSKYLLMVEFLAQLRLSTKYDMWRKDVLKQQRKSCQVCGSRQKVHVHHIVPLAKIYKEFVSRYNYNNPFELELLLDVAEDYEDFWDLDNGIVLCSWCHQLEHPDKNIF